MRICRQILIVLLFFITTRTLGQHEISVNSINPTGFAKPRAFGLAVGAGTSRFKVTNSNWKQGTINYNDSLNSITSKSGFKFDVSLLYFINFNQTFAFRPTITVSFTEDKILYNKFRLDETIDASTVSGTASLPILFKFRSKSVQPFIVAGPSFSFVLGQDDKGKNFLPLKKVDLLGDIGFGIDIDIPKWIVITSPEIKYSSGFLNRKEEANNLYTNTIEQLKRRTFTFTIYMRDR